MPSISTPSYTAIPSDIQIKHDSSRSSVENDMSLPLRLLSAGVAVGWDFLLNEAARARRKGLDV